MSHGDDTESVSTFAFVIDTIVLLTVTLLIFGGLLLGGCAENPTGDYGFESEQGDGTPTRPAERPDVGLVQYEPEHKLDLPKSDDGCETLDVLFVVDNSGSMTDDRERVAQLVPEFAMRLGSLVSDLHIGVATTGPTPCNYRGALLAEPVGPWDGYRFMTTPDDLEQTVQLADGGGSTELGLLAAIQAIDPATPCTEGFHRENSGLVITIISDEDEQTPGGRATLYSILKLLHGNDRIAIVLLVNLDQSSRYMDLLNAAPNAFMASMYDDDFGAVFDEAVRSIASVCKLPPPEG